MIEFRRDNHFVPKLYLKNWSPDGQKIWGYRTLVSRDNIPHWKLHSIRGIAYHENLYTRFYNGTETDEFELWLEREFETPAESAIQKATSDRKLTADDWERLIRFTAAQCVRTPAKLIKSLEKWREEMPNFLESTLKETVKKLEIAKQTGILPNPKSTDDDTLMPIRISHEPSADPGFSLVKAETVVGRSLWLFEIKHILMNTLKVLYQHKWSIFNVAPNVEWVTSDDPVICLNYYKEGHYDFGGGWGYKGSEIILPLSPKHILYTQVGSQNKSRLNASEDLSLKLQKIIAEHSYRWIFSKEPNKDIEKLHPRVIDANMFNREAEEWNRWHNDQSAAERDINLKIIKEKL